MTQPRHDDRDVFLRAMRGNEFDVYAALMAEADALHHAEVNRQIPDLIKPAEWAQPHKDDFISRLKDPDHLLDAAVVSIGTSDGVAGFVHAVVLDRAESRVHNANRVVRIELIVVAERHRRNGIGRRLMERAQHWAMSKAADALILNCYAFNIVAARLYEKAGFGVLQKMYAMPLTGERAREAIR